MPNKPLRVILDTNLWISFLITGNYSKLDELLFTYNAILIFSDELLKEFITVANRPKLRRYFSEAALENLLEVIDDYAEFIEVKTSVSTCRDAKDNFLLSLAADSKADYLVTGDNDLLVLNKFQETQIIAIADLLKSI